MNSCGRVWGYRLMLALSLLIACAATASAQTPGSAGDSLKFPLNDKAASTDSKPGTLDLNDPANVKRTVEYDEKEDKFYFVDKVGDQYIRTPTYMTQEEYQRYKAEQDERSYWRRRMDANTMFNKKPELPTMYKEGMFDRIFGGTGIQVRPQGNVDVTFGGNWQNIKNPALTQRQQKFGAFNFDLQMNINLLATIGDKMKLNISNNTKATFDFQNMQRVEYTGKEDEIIKKIEAGNTSFPLKSALLSGRQSLFGLKTQLQFGKLWVTTVLSQQKSKQNSLTIQGGAQTQQFNIKADAYEENKNFLLAHYFRDNYNKALKNFPVINSLITINKIEVWIANRTGAVTGVRSILAFMDLGESKPYNTSLIPGAVPLNLPDNSANDLYSRLQQLPNARMQSGYALAMESLGLKQGLDFSTVTARKLNPSEYSFNPQLGYISLNTQPNPDEVIGVAFRYTYNGKVYQVGEFSEDLTPDSTNQRMVFLKLLKGTSNSPKLPIWDLMMKNVYAIGGYGISKESFRLNVLYQDPGGGEKRYLPEGESAGVPLLSVLNLDRLNQQNDPSPDGVFDFVEGITINTQQGKVIFPVLEPFGSDLIPAIGTDPVLQRKYPYQILYDSTKTVALQSQQNNRYIMRGTYKSSSSSEISLGGFNIPQGSVSVTAGGQRLVENQDYQIDYGLGRIKILNTGILNSGIPINVQYEDNATFGFQQQNFTGSRFDYILNPKLTLGGTFMRLTERPFTQKTTIGEDPIRNTNLGLDASYQSEFPALTRALDKLPIYSTTASSFITASGEVAGLFPGHSKVIDGVDPGGTVYIDDFEGTRSSYDLKTPVQNWMLASTPTQAVAKDGSILFPEATLDTRAYNSNRAKLAWYQIEPTLVDPTGGTPGYVKSDPDQHYIRLVQVQDVFPQTSNNTLQNSLATFDLSFYPQERGPYNFDVDNIDPATGKLLNPKQRWGGITRYIDNTDFEQSNVEYIEMWILDPFINNRSLSSGGSLYVNLGDISEDVMKDHNMAYENGITNPKDTTKLVSTIWGYAPSFGMQITRSFDNDPTTRSLQDVGFDLMNNDEETQKFQDYLDGLRFKVGATSPAFLQAQKDPANDDYHYFRGDEYDNAYILQRYKRYNNTQGNSPIADNNSSFSSANTTYPESEDLNKDNTLNEAENYYQYRIDLAPNMKVGTNFITDRYDNPGVTLPNGQKEPETWYQFKIPIAEFQNKVGNINDFRSIRFMRMYLSGFEDSVTVRFGRLQLGRNTWRRYMYSLLNPGENIPIDNSSTDFTLLSVSVEENSKRSPIPYVIPPGVTRQQQAVSNGQTIQQNEQSLSLQICNLKDGDARGVFKSLGSTDIRQFDKLRLFVHAEAQVGKSSLQNGDVQMFMRIGSDFTNNYYEYRRPLNVTLAGASTQGDIWPSSNEVALTLDDLVSIKTHRNDKNQPTYVPYQETLSDGSVVVVVGQPNIGDAKNVMLGVVNPKKDNTRPSDDGLPKCLEVWFDELRVSGISTTPAYAAAGKTNIQLADLGSVRLSGSTSTAGYGSIDQKVNQRSQNSIYTYDASSNLQLGKLMPRNWGVSLPFFMGYSENVSNPKYNPYDLDQKMENLLAATADPAKRDSLKRAAQDFTSITSFNIANARILGNTKSNNKPKFYSIKNFDFSYSYNKQFKHNSLIESDNMVTQAFGLGYTHNFKSKPIEPFKKLVHSKSKWFSLIKDFNFNPVPVNFSFRNDMNRVMEETQVRVIGDGEYKIAPIYFKNFIWTRTYNMRWELTKSLSFDYSAINRSRIDEPYGRIDTKEKRDSLWTAIKNLGRNTQFSQNFNASYNVPLAKTPLTDWTSLKLTYGATYTWTAASRLAENLGNTIANTSQKQINGELNFAQLYNKNRWLKAVNAPVQPKPGGAQLMGGKGGQLPAGKFGGNGAQTVSGPGGNLTDMKASSEALPVDKPADTDKSKKKKKDVYQEQPYVPKVIDLTGYTDAQIDSVKQVQKAEEIAHKKAEAAKKKAAKKAARLARRNSVPEISRAERFGGKLITMLKRVTMNYTESGGTTLPGFMDSAKYLGVSSTGSPGLAYAFGYQPQLAWLDQLGKEGKLSRDTLFNAQFSQSYSQNISMTAQVEPIADLRIDFSANRTFSKTFSELYKDTSYQSTPQFNNLNQYHTGTFSQSYIGLKTMFKPSSSRSGTFLEFVNNRVTISSRLGASNPYTNNVQDPNDRAYKKGYTAYSQEVLIPAFLAAYTGQNASSVALLDYDNRNKLNSNPFRFYLPAPNWRITYNGLTKLPGFKMIFNNIVISSAYTGTMSMNSFNSALTYQDLRGVGFPSFIDSNTGNYIPYFQVPNITLTDQLNPMFAVDVALKNNLTTKFEIRRNRVVSLSLIDYQVSETRSFEYVFGLGYRVRGMRLPFPIAGKRVLKNDLNIKVDVGIRDDKTTNTYLSLMNDVVSRGQKVITIAPTIDYLINQSFTIRFFYNRSQTIPYVTTSYPITTTSGGLTLRFMFAQ